MGLGKPKCSPLATCRLLCRTPAKSSEVSIGRITIVIPKLARPQHVAAPCAQRRTRRRTAHPASHSPSRLRKSARVKSVGATNPFPVGNPLAELARLGRALVARKVECRFDAWCVRCSRCNVALYCLVGSRCFSDRFRRVDSLTVSRPNVDSALLCCGQHATSKPRCLVRASRKVCADKSARVRTEEKDVDGVHSDAPNNPVWVFFGPVRTIFFVKFAPKSVMRVNLA